MNALAKLAAQVAATSTYSYGEVMTALRDMSDRDQLVRAETAEQIAQAIESAARSHDGTARPKSYQDLADLARQLGGLA